MKSFAFAVLNHSEKFIEGAVLHLGVIEAEDDKQAEHQAQLAACNALDVTLEDFGSTLSIRLQQTPRSFNERANDVLIGALSKDLPTIQREVISVFRAYPGLAFPEHRIAQHICAQRGSAPLVLTNLRGALAQLVRAKVLRSRMSDGGAAALRLWEINTSEEEA